MSKLEEAKESLSLMQEFDQDTLVRAELGESFEFRDVILPAQKLIGLYKKLDLEALEDLPEKSVSEMKRQADSDYLKFKAILDYDPNNVKGVTPKEERDRLVKAVEKAYDSAFLRLYQFVLYGVFRFFDQQEVEKNLNERLGIIEEESRNITSNLKDYQKKAQDVLDDIREVAAEQGVSQQSVYFKDEAESHDRFAETWRIRTVRLAWVLGVYAFASMFLHKCPWLQPEDTIQYVQLITSKVLIFGVISYMMFLSSKNFLSHKHSAIVNRHRQTALMTYTVIADSAATKESKDIVLNHASICIFSPQDTGFVKSVYEPLNSTRSVVELIPKFNMKYDLQ